MTRPIEGAGLPPVVAAKPKGRNATDGFRARLEAAIPADDAAAETSRDALLVSARMPQPDMALQIALTEQGEDGADPTGTPLAEAVPDVLVAADPLADGSDPPAAVEQVARAIIRAVSDRSAVPETTPSQALPTRTIPTVLVPDAGASERPAPPPVANVTSERHHAPALPALDRLKTGAAKPRTESVPVGERPSGDASRRAEIARPLPQPGGAVEPESVPELRREPVPRVIRRAMPAQQQAQQPMRGPAAAHAAGTPSIQSGEPAAFAQILRPAMAEATPRATPEPQAMPAQSAPAPDMQGGIVKTLRLRLTPPELGEVAVRMRLTDAGLEVHLQPSRPETAHLLRQDRDTIAGLLRAAGYAADTASVTVAERGAQSGGPGFGDTAGQRGTGDGAQNPAEGRAGRSGDQDTRTDHRAKAEHQHEDATDPARPSGDLYL